MDDMDLEDEIEFEDARRGRGRGRGRGGMGGSGRRRGNFCHSQRTCPTESKPVCGTNGVSYVNYCQLKKAWCVDNTIKMKHKRNCGECKQDCATVTVSPMRPWKSQPLCGMNDVSYDNYCIFEN